MTTKGSAGEKPDYSDLKAAFINCTLTPAPSFSHTECLVDVVRAIMEDAGVSVLTAISPSATRHSWPGT